MCKTVVLNNVASFNREFTRCCREYSHLDVAVAWAGNPVLTFPFKALQGNVKTIRTTVGTAFNQTHPDAIVWLKENKADVRVVRDSVGLFHPKVYLFRDGECFALFVGSSNLTYGGFRSNSEVNCLIEGPNVPDDIAILQRTLDEWRSDEFSFVPSSQWLTEYRKRYMSRPPQAASQSMSAASWLREADWDAYYAGVLTKLRDLGRSVQGYHDVLDAARELLPVPWSVTYFDDIERRRLIGGIGKYGWLGHVSASISFKSMVAKGPVESWRTITTALNSIAEMDEPLDWRRLEKQLVRLRSLGPTMNVWGRLLCLVRPDLYCTVSNESVRTTLSLMAGVPRTRFSEPGGYVKLIELIHSLPWFNSKSPSTPEESAVWRRRVGFLDGVLYS